MDRTHVIVLAAAAALAAGCASDPRPPPMIAASSLTATDATPRPVLAPPPPPPAPRRMDTSSPTSGSVHLDERIVRACGDLPAAHFAFDSSRIEMEAAAALDALARCFSTGPLRGRSMRLIGHTDSRGEVEYNLGLGQRRSGSVAAYLGAHGVEKAHMATSSRGEFDATGTDEEGWARDRKVDVLLAD